MIYAPILFDIVAISLFGRLYMLIMEVQCASYLRFMPS